jgi:hypothetical protein
LSVLKLNEVLMMNNAFKNLCREIDHIDKGGELVYACAKEFKKSIFLIFSAPLCLMQCAFWKAYFQPHSSLRSHNLIFTGIMTMFFGALLFMALWIFAKWRPYFVINSDGFRFGKNRILIQWSNVKQIRERSDLWRHRYIDFELFDNNAYLCQIVGWRYIEAKFFIKLGFPIVSLMITSLNRPADRIFELVEVYVAKAKSKHGT